VQGKGRFDHRLSALAGAGNCTAGQTACAVERYVEGAPTGGETTLSLSLSTTAPGPGQVARRMVDRLEGHATG